jgi:hypothetical protein
MSGEKLPRAHKRICRQPRDLNEAVKVRMGREVERLLIARNGGKRDPAPRR